MENRALLNIEHLEDAVTRLMDMQSQRADDDLATIIPQIWLRAGDILNYHHLVVGKYVDFYCQRSLWIRSGYQSFKEAWDAEGIPDVSYAAVKGWQYAFQCQVLSGLEDGDAAIQPIGKLISAKPILQRAIDRGEDTYEMVNDLADADVSQEMWFDRYSTPVQIENGKMSRDRVTINSTNGQITYWINAGEAAGVGLPMGHAVVDGDGQWAWRKVISGDVKIDWV
jgi:hypothetical protein